MKRWTILIPSGLLALYLATALGCGHSASATPELEPESDALGVVLCFKIARHERRPDGSQTLSATALLKGRPVGFDLELSTWRENPPGFVNMTTWESKAVLRSQGAPSDELLRFLDAQYATRVSPSHMLPAVEVQAFSPWKNPGDFQRDNAKFLLLFPSALGDPGSAELRIEVDADDARLYLKEKDKRLRSAVILALNAPA
jgi:hypothetical protein